MPEPSAEVLPFSMEGGWPEPPRGCIATIRESGILLGELNLDEAAWKVLQALPVFSVRVDDHPARDSWTTREADGTESRVEFEIPLDPVLVPRAALESPDAFGDWVLDTHGALGRLLIWDASRRWWIVHEPDLELVLTCAPPGTFTAESEELSWIACGSERGRQQVDDLMVRFGVSWAG